MCKESKHPKMVIEVIGEIPIAIEKKALTMPATILQLLNMQHFVNHR